jgi:hypothetical protein
LGRVVSAFVVKLLSWSPTYLGSYQKTLNSPHFPPGSQGSYLAAGAENKSLLVLFFRKEQSSSSQIPRETRDVQKFNLRAVG